MSRKPAMTLVVLSALAWLGAGCAQQSQPATFYVLSYEGEAGPPGTGTTTREGPSVGVGPVSLPEYLDRPQIVRRASRNRLEIQEFDRWGEPLDDNFTAVLMEVLSAELQTDRIAAHPWNAPFQAELQVIINVTKFDTDDAGHSVLEVRWRLIDVRRQRILTTARSTFQQDLAPGTTGTPLTPSYDAVAAAMSRNVVAFGQEIAQRIRAAASS